MNYYRRPENKLESLLRWRRNVFLQAPGGGYVLVSATRFLLTLHHFNGSLRHEPACTEHLDPIPNLFDGNGWNLALLGSIESISPQNVQSEEKMSENQQPYAALYCKPMKASIRNMTNIECKVFLALAMYADDQGICYPGVRELGETTGLTHSEVSEALQGLQRKSFIHYLRYNQVDPLTRKMQPNVLGISPTFLHLNSDSGIQTYMHEFLSHVLPSKSAQPESPRSNSINQNQEPTPVTTTTNQLQDARAREMQKLSEGERASAPGKAQDYANQSPQPQPAQSATQNSENDLPPRDTGKLDSYVTPLPQIDAEAYANEMRHLVSGLQLAKARQLVDVYGVEMCGLAVRLLAKQPFKSVDNPPGWIINKLRQGALLPVDGAPADSRTKEERGEEYINNQWSDFIEH